MFSVNHATLIKQVNPKAQSLKLLNEHVEGFWQFRPDDWLVLDDRLVRLGTAIDVVRLDG